MTAARRVALGVETLLQSRRELISGKRIGLVTNYNVTDSALRPIVNLLVEDSAWTVAKLFGPEHGMFNCAKEGEDVASGTDPHTGLPVYSLYGDSYRPTAEMLSNLDVLVVDLPDIGCRYYTNMNTLAYCLEACAETGLPCIILDRPNPIGGTMREGNLLDENFKSFVGLLNVPNRHGMTMGELALLHNRSLKKRAALTVVPCVGWERSMWQEDTRIPFVGPSPNTANLDMVALYPGTCLFEGTNLSEGRGTTHPFEIIGAPYIDAFTLANAFNQRQLAGVIARPTYFVPTYKKHIGVVCEGVQLHVTDKLQLRPLLAGVTLIDIVATIYHQDFEFSHKDNEGRYFFDLLAGTDRLRKLVESGRTLDFMDECEVALRSFEENISDLLLY